MRDLPLHDRAAHRQAVVALDEHAEALRDVDADRLDHQVRNRPVVDPELSAAVERARDLLDRVALAAQLHVTAESAADIAGLLAGRWLALLRCLVARPQPLLELDRREPQVAAPRCRGRARVESESAAQLAARGAC